MVYESLSLHGRPTGSPSVRLLLRPVVGASLEHERGKDLPESARQKLRRWRSGRLWRSSFVTTSRSTDETGPSPKSLSRVLLRCVMPCCWSHCLSRGVACCGAGEGASGPRDADQQQRSNSNAHPIGWEENLRILVNVPGEITALRDAVLLERLLEPWSSLLWCW